MIDTLRLTAEEVLGPPSGRRCRGEPHGAYLDAVAERDEELHAYLRVVEDAEGDGVPIALKDVISTKGVAPPRARNPRRLRARLRCDRGGALQTGGAADDR